MEAALARAAGKCFGADAGTWLERLGEWLRGAAGRLEPVQAWPAVTEELPRGAVGKLERSNGAAGQRAELAERTRELERSSQVADCEAPQKGEQDEKSQPLSLAA
jgi:hypothetical protein